MDLFLLLTALLCGLTGVDRSAAAPVRTVETSRLVAVARVVALPSARVVAPRPDGYIAAEPAMLDLAFAHRFARPAAPERRRE
jgi:hypothetical protein